MAIIMGHDLKIWDWLARAGVIESKDKGEYCRCIIDINVDETVMVYLTKYGEPLMFEVEPPNLSGARVIKVSDTKGGPT